MFESGNFEFGVNYFASETATRMWREWNLASVNEDLKALKNCGVKWLRIFPLWNDFQPIKMLTTWGGTPYEVVYDDETPLDDSEEGRAGIKKEMADRLEKLMDLAEYYGMKVDLAIFTGFMSSMNYLPPMLSDRNIFTDSLCLEWELKYLYYLVNRFCHHPALGGWDLGNECSVMRNIGENVPAQYVWSRTMADAVRAIDSDHPVISGLASYSLDALSPKGEWELFHHAGAVDVLTTHPYPIFRQPADPLDSMRPILHTAAECSLFEDLGKKPCFIEESGSIGYQTCSYNSEADFVRGDLLSAFLHGCHGYFWWCAFDQGHFAFPPYNWNNIGSDYGMLTADRQCKPSAQTAQALMQAIGDIKLPKYLRQAVCVVPRCLGGTAAGVAANVFCLAAENDLGVRFCSVNDEAPESDLYILPRLSNNNAVTRVATERLLKRVENGATLLITFEGAFMRLFPQITGMQVKHREAPATALTVTLGDHTLPVHPNYIYTAEQTDARILAEFSDGSPAILCHTIGKGQVISCLFSPEKEAASTRGAFSREDAPAYSEVYRLAMETAGVVPPAYTENPFVCAKVHPISAHRSVVSLMNYSDRVQEYRVRFAKDTKVGRILYGKLNGKLDAMDAVLFEIEN